jgi:hypothetical protein
MKIKDKHGELTTKQLVTIIILIVSFIIVLFLLFKLNLGETTNKEVCHNSVILKERSGILAGPLDCRTNYLCISGGEDCEEIPTTSTIDVDSENKNETMKALADEMSDCWWMFGEGKMDYIDTAAFERVACSICSIVEFDETLHETSISYEEFYNYLKTAPKTQAQTYLKYLYATDDLETLQEQFDNLEGFKKDPSPENYLSRNFEFDKIYFILTGMAKEGILTPRWKIWETKETPYPVVILERTQENYDKVECDTFLTKA